jgi:hypothetical protein
LGRYDKVKRIFLIVLIALESVIAFFKPMDRALMESQANVPISNVFKVCAYSISL